MLRRWKMTSCCEAVAIEVNEMTRTLYHTVLTVLIAVDSAFKFENCSQDKELEATLLINVASCVLALWSCCTCCSAMAEGEGLPTVMRITFSCERVWSLHVPVSVSRRRGSLSLRMSLTGS